MAEGPALKGAMWRWIVVIAILLSGLMVGIAIDMSAANLANATRYQIVGDTRAVWRLDRRSGDLVYCEIDPSERDGMRCRKIEERALR
jgi:hypothetical protein